MNEADRFDRAIERLLADESPRAEASALDAEEQQMLRMAQLLRGSKSEPASPEFVDSLHDRLFPQSRRVSRRTAFISGIGTMAAGLLAGFGLDHLSRGGNKTAAWTPLVGKNGSWVAVAAATDVPHGAIKTFTAGAVQGFLVNRNGEIRALSRICTHMGCALNFEKKDQAFICPCHGAEFDLRGNSRYGPTHYPVQLPPLPEIRVRVHGPSIEVWSV